MQELKSLVRIAGTTIDGTKRVPYGLAYIKGIGINLAFAITRAVGIDENKKIGELTEEEIEKLEKTIQEIAGRLPTFLLNKRKDLWTGEDKHLIGPDLVFDTRKHIDFMKKIKCWKGIRHALGLKVRGQRTRTTGRKGRTVGVKRKKR